MFGTARSIAFLRVVIWRALSLLNRWSKTKVGYVHHKKGIFVGPPKVFANRVGICNNMADFVKGQQRGCVTGPHPGRPHIPLPHADGVVRAVGSELCEREPAPC